MAQDNLLQTHFWHRITKLLKTYEKQHGVLFTLTILDTHLQTLYKPTKNECQKIYKDFPTPELAEKLL